ncbi:MAG: gamma-glutamylcyclotransferase family protein [Isosphaeraceae bacterium]
MQLFFAYGTLAPDTSDVASLEGWMADAVRGRLYDLGAYPALVDHDDQDADWVEGYVRPVSLDQLTGSLDSYEGVGEGLYRRVQATTRAGRQVWVYVYARPVPPSAIGPLPRWNSTKRVRLIAPPGNQQGVL